MATAGVAVAIVLAPARPCSAQDPSLTVGVLPLRIGPKIPASRESLEKMVQRGLAILAAPLVEAPESAARLKVAGAKVPCEDPSCWMAAGRAVGVRYLIDGDVQLNGGFFEVRFDLIDATSGRVLGTEPNRCEAADCSVAELCRLTVRELTRQTLSPTPRLSPPLASTDKPLYPESPPTPLSGIGSGEPTAAKDGQSPFSIRTAMAAVAITGGIASLIAGGYYIQKDGECSKYDVMLARCDERHNTIWGGLGWAAGGLVGITTGIVIAWPSRSGEGAGGRAQVTIAPNRILLFGRF